MKKGIVCILLMVVLAALAFGAISCQGEQTLVEKRAAMIEALSDGKYDKDFNLVDLAGTDVVNLAGSQRAVLVEGFYKDEKGKQQQISANIALGWIYHQKYVAIPIQLFYVMDPMYGAIPAWQIPEISFKVSLLPDTRVDDDWQKEELGKIKFNEDLQLAVAERTNPIINIPADYVLGRYQDLSVGNVLYATSQTNGRITIEPSAVCEVYNTNENLFAGSRDITFNELGGLAFALRDGKPELVGFLNVLETAQEEGMAYIHYLDIQHVISYINTISSP